MRAVRNHRVRFFSTIVAIMALAGSVWWVATSASGTTPPAPDKIQYSQQNGKNGTYLKYIPGDGSAATTQSVTGGGGCATPNATNPVLAFSANSYPNGDYNATPSAAVVGAFNSRTGVCATPQAWSIEAGEGLDFAPGPNALTTGRTFTSASLIMEREDKAAGNATMQFAFFRNNVKVATQQKPIGPGVGTQVTFNSAPVSGGFDRVEIQLPAALSPAGVSVSVVGPLSTFVFESKICQGQTINAASTDSNQVTASLTLQSAGCKEYASFTASTTSDPSGTVTKTIDFDSAQSATAHVTSTFDFFDANCNANGSTTTVGTTTVPPCPTTFVDWGTGLNPEVFCGVDSVTGQAVHPAGVLWCVTQRNVSYASTSGVTTAHIQEQWDGFGDIIFKH